MMFKIRDRVCRILRRIITPRGRSALLNRFSPAGAVKSFTDRLFGYDFFISYAWHDGPEYPRQLAERLTQSGFSVFIDTREFVPGIDLRTSTKRRIRMSSQLLVIVRQ